MRKFSLLVVVCFVMFAVGCESNAKKREEEVLALRHTKSLEAEKAPPKIYATPEQVDSAINQKLTENNKKQEEIVDQKIEKRVKPVETSLAENGKKTDAHTNALQALKVSTENLKTSTEEIRKDLQKRDEKNLKEEKLVSEKDKLINMVVQLQKDIDALKKELEALREAYRGRGRIDRPFLLRERKLLDDIETREKQKLEFIRTIGVLQP